MLYLLRMNPDIHDAILNIHQKLSKISSISLQELELIAPIIKLEKLEAGQFIIRPGDSSLKISIVIKGLAKTYYNLETGKEHITHFGSEGSFLGVYTDMLKGNPSTGYIETLEPTIILVMNYQEMMNTTKNSLAWAHLLRLITEERYVYRSDKDRNITLKTALEKFEYFKATHPDLINRIPQNQIALYLNITPATLSRLKNSTGNYKK